MCLQIVAPRGGELAPIVWALYSDGGAVSCFEMTLEASLDLKPFVAAWNGTHELGRGSPDGVVIDFPMVSEVSRTDVVVCASLPRTLPVLVARHLGDVANAGIADG